MEFKHLHRRKENGHDQSAIGAINNSWENALHVSSVTGQDMLQRTADLEKDGPVLSAEAQITSETLVPDRIGGLT